VLEAEQDNALFRRYITFAIFALLGFQQDNDSQAIINFTLTTDCLFSIRSAAKKEARGGTKNECLQK
jgi:hypothetical protein